MLHSSGAWSDPYLWVPELGDGDNQYNELHGAFKSSSTARALEFASHMGTDITRQVEKGAHDALASLGTSVSNVGFAHIGDDETENGVQRRLAAVSSSMFRPIGKGQLSKSLIQSDYFIGRSTNIMSDARGPGINVGRPLDTRYGLRGKLKRAMLGQGDQSLMGIGLDLNPRVYKRQTLEQPSGGDIRSGIVPAHASYSISDFMEVSPAPTPSEELAYTQVGLVQADQINSATNLNILPEQNYRASDSYVQGSGDRIPPKKKDLITIVETALKEKASRDFDRAVTAKQKSDAAAAVAKQQGVDAATEAAQQYADEAPDRAAAKIVADQTQADKITAARNAAAAAHDAAETAKAEFDAAEGAGKSQRARAIAKNLSDTAAASAAAATAKLKKAENEGQTGGGMPSPTSEPTGPNPTSEPTGPSPTSEPTGPIGRPKPTGSNPEELDEGGGEEPGVDEGSLGESVVADAPSNSTAAKTRQDAAARAKATADAEAEKADNERAAAQARADEAEKERIEIEKMLANADPPGNGEGEGETTFTGEGAGDGTDTGTLASDSWIDTSISERAADTTLARFIDMKSDTGAFGSIFDPERASDQMIQHVYYLLFVDMNRRDRVRGVYKPNTPTYWQHKAAYAKRQEAVNQLVGLAKRRNIKLPTTARDGSPLVIRATDDVFPRGNNSTANASDDVGHFRWFHP